MQALRRGGGRNVPLRQVQFAALFFAFVLGLRLGQRDERAEHLGRADERQLFE